MFIFASIKHLKPGLSSVGQLQTCCSHCSEVTKTRQACGQLEFKKSGNVFWWNLPHPRVLALECVVPCFSPVITPSTHSHLFSHQIKYQPSRVQLYEMATVFVKRHTYLRLSNSYKFMPCWLAPGRQESERRVGVSMIRKNNWTIMGLYMLRCCPACTPSWLFATNN